MPSYSNPKIEVSWGELIDKITILEIKESRLASPRAVAGVRRELHLLQSAARDIASSPQITQLKDELSGVNRELWQIEDDIRAMEASQTFDERFIELARLVYTRNDHRAALKYRINQVTNSALVEHKQYTSYDEDRIRQADAGARARGGGRGVRRREPDREPDPL